MNFFKKIQNLPEKIRKIILWLVIIAISLGLIFLWVKNLQKKLKSFQSENFKKQFDFPTLPNLHNLKEELKKVETIQ